MALRDIVGQDRALKILFGTLKRDRVPSSILLSGDSGIGKRLVALNYAKAINCLQPVNFDCCDKCMSCKKIDYDNHPDVLIVTLENMEDKLGLEKRESKDDSRYEIPIGAIRRIEEIISLKPNEGKKKVIIIDDADTMNINAANAFLKTLEEPPEDSLILLISPNPDRLPDTIRSRCINVRFYPLSANKCREVILKNVKCKQEDLEFLLNLSMGRPGLVISRDFIKEREWFAKLLSGMIRGDSKDAWTDKSEIKAWTDMAFVLLRDMVVFKVTAKESDLLLHSMRQYSANSRIENIEINSLLIIYNSLLSLKSLLDFNLNKSITWNYVSTIMRKAIGDG